jgi:hypothetical protein
MTTERMIFFNTIDYINQFTKTIPTFLICLN